MKFGLFVPQGWRHDLVGIDPAQHWGVMAGIAARADGHADWSSIWVYDHFHPVPEPTDAAVHEAWSLMAALAATTSRVRIGQMCTCMSYRNPAYLAKVAATIDVISEGRLEMGIGAGWYEHEWRAYGYDFPRAGIRLARLREGVEIMRQMWTTGTARLDGEHYQVDGAMCFPRPLQGTSSPGSRANGIPLWVAGGGEKVTLRIAAEYADYTNFFPAYEEFAAKNELLKGHCRDIGRDESEIVRSSNFDIVIGRSAAEIADRIAGVRARLIEGGVSEAAAEARVEAMRQSPGCGTPGQLVERLHRLGGVGLGYAITYFAEAAYDLSGVELFEREVIPELVDREEHGHLWHLLHGR
ncbi:MAG: LLM class F420-dependent oxidoreductase [Tetrasphaera sp.]|nr:LLM class F420-dependent oxidoreductase [Tetrasphaera sp.]